MVNASPQPIALLGWMDGLADTTRLRVLLLLERHELGVADLCDVLQMPQSSVSRHLKVLTEQKWLCSRKEGTNHLYRMILDELEPAARRLWLLTREQIEGWAEPAQDQLRLTSRLSKPRRSGNSKAFFAGAAGEWDNLRTELYGREFTESALLSLLPCDLVVADLGCGTGTMTARLAGFVRQIIAVDNSPEMLTAAARRTAGIANVDLRQGELDALPVVTATCDAALLVLSLTYAPCAADVLAEVSRILKPGGRLVLVDLLPHDREEFRVKMGQRLSGFDPAGLEQMLHSVQMTGVTIRPLPPEANAKGPALFLATSVRRAI